jgi:large subunit ribosomal protein L2
MALRRFRPITAGRRHAVRVDLSQLSDKAPEKALISKRSSSGGRNSQGRVTNVNTGGGHKRRYRVVDFRRLKRDVPARVVALEYDPNRSSHLALLAYADGAKTYILAPQGLSVGSTVMAGESVEVRVGNALPLRSIPTGQPIHNLELKPGRGGQLVRSAGNAAQLVAKEGKYALVKLPSGEMRKILSECYATVGGVGNADHSNQEFGKAGRSRWLGIRPKNRGVARNPVDHPMGGGEGKTSGGRHPVSQSAVPAKGFKTRKNKRTAAFIVRRRGAKK